MATVDDGAVDSVDTLFNAAGDTTGAAYTADEDVSVPLSDPVDPPAPPAPPTHRLFEEEPASPRREPPRRASRRQRASGHVGKRSRAGARRRPGRSRGRHTWGDTPLIAAIVQGRVSRLHLGALCFGIVVLTVLVSVLFAGGGSGPDGDDAKPTSAHRAAPVVSQAGLLEARRSAQRSQPRRAARQAAANRAAARHRADRRRAAALRADRLRAARARARRATPPAPAPHSTTTRTTTSHSSPTTRPRAPAPPTASGGTPGYTPGDLPASCTPGDLGC